MTATLFLGSLLTGLLGAMVFGALSGLRIGKEALGAELAAFMGGLYGVVSGALAVIAGLIILVIL